VSVVLWPESIVAPLPALQDSAESTVTVTDELEDAAGVPDEASVTTSVYVVVAVGLTDCVLPVPSVVLPDFQV
jgi:hypothetical protein